MMRIAVIGGGPKSLFALLALNDLISLPASRRIVVDVFDPLPPGAGSVWRVDQPEVMRLNVTASIVDASSSLSSETFIAWINRVAPELSGENYPPRRLVGRYLQEQFQLLSQRGKINVSHLPFAVTGVQRDGKFWQVSGPFGDRLYDEVLLATGHGLAIPDASRTAMGALNVSPLIGDYGALLEPSRIPPGADVWIRGAALTAYDVALLLTEGRGGTWQQITEEHDGAQTQLKYFPSGEEPRRITMFSRSGALMDPKSETVLPAITKCLNEYQQRLRRWGKEVQARGRDTEANLNGMWVLLLCCAQDCARANGVTVSARMLWRTALTGQSVDVNGGATIQSLVRDSAARLQKSIAVNQLGTPVTTGWLWARVWSGLYSELISAMDRLPLNTIDSVRFRNIAGNLEKFTFGPPEITARKLVALFGAGILHVAAPNTRPSAGSILIDAVTPGPGVLRTAAPGGHPHSELFAKLLYTGDIWVRPGDRGLVTEADGTCVARDGSRRESLAAVGRPTEDPTLGHDTLNRSLHKEHRLWAERIAGLASNPTQRIGHCDG